MSKYLLSPAARALLVVAALLLSAVSAAGQSDDPRWQKCNDKNLDPVVRIGNCTLRIEVKSLTKEDSPRPITIAVARIGTRTTTTGPSRITTRRFDCETDLSRR